MTSVASTTRATGRRSWRSWAAAIALAGLLAAAIVAALGIGAVATAPTEAAQSLAFRLGLVAQAPPNDGVVWGIRYPRVLLGVVVGATLAVSGVALQGLYRTQLADPQLLGIGPGAAVGAVIGTGAGGVQGGVAGGAVAGLAAAFLVQRIGRASSDEPTRFVLSGVALGAMLSAWVGFFVLGLDRSAIPPLDFWLLGSLAGATWRAAGTVTVLAVLGLAGLFAARRALDILSLGDANAAGVGVDVELLRTAVLMVVGVVSGATVGAVGVVGFIGLLVPALLRPYFGPAHGRLLLASAAGGGLLVVAADTAARSVASPIELPVGLITAAVGGPVLIWVISRTRGWT